MVINSRFVAVLASGAAALGTVGAISAVGASLRRFPRLLLNFCTTPKVGLAPSRRPSQHPLSKGCRDRSFKA